MSGTLKLAAILAADFLGHWRFPDIPRADRNGGFAQILLKNSNFRLDHNSEDRWQSR